MSTNFELVCQIKIGCFSIETLMEVIMPEVIIQRDMSSNFEVNQH